MLFSRLIRYLKTVLLSLILSAIFSIIFIGIFLRHFAYVQQLKRAADDAAQAAKQSGSNTPNSYHIDAELALKLNAVWLDIAAHDNRPEDAKYNVNVSISDNMSFDRELPKTRHAACDSIVYDEATLPTICVIVPFYNEPLSLLIRTMHSILNRTPQRLLTELIIVDDASVYEDLGAPLARYVALLPKLILMRNPTRQGLIRTRFAGLSKCTADVVLFQDAHTEVNVGWAQPILRHLQRHPNHIIQPAIDSIEPDSLEYNAGFEEIHDPQTTTFSWDLRYVWIQTPDRVLKYRRSYADPVPTPTIVGCTMAFNRKHFLSFGSFDEHMDIWGGENLELPFRYWQCGAAVFTHPCARIGHVFKAIPYTFGDKTSEVVVQHNLARVAEVWMGPKMKRLFYATTWVSKGRRFNFTEDGFDVQVKQRRRDTFEKFQCKPFDWFVKYVSPEVRVPPPEAVWYGEMFGSKTESCAYVMQCGHIGMTPNCGFHIVRPEHQFYLTADGRIHSAAMPGKCMTIEEDTSLMIFADCSSAAVIRYYFIHGGEDYYGNIAVEAPDGEGFFCATHVTFRGRDAHFHPNGDQMVQMMKCDVESPYQLWFFPYKFDYENMPELLH